MGYAVERILHSFDEFFNPFQHAIKQSRELIQFSTQTNNIGPGALVIGNPLDHPECFDLVTCHGHPHIQDYADYRLWTEAGYERWRALRAAHPGVPFSVLLTDFADFPPRFWIEPGVDRVIVGTERVVGYDATGAMSSMELDTTPPLASTTPAFDAMPGTVAYDVQNHYVRVRARRRGRRSE